MTIRVVLTACFWSLLLAAAPAEIRMVEQIPAETKQQISINKKIAQTLTIDKNDISSEVEEHALLESVSGKRGDDGLLPVEYRFTSWQVDVDVLGNKVRFDAANPEERNEDSPLDVLLDPYRRMADKPFTLVLDEDNRVVDFKGWDDLTDGLDEKSAQLHKEMFDPDYLRSVWNSEFQRLPSEAVKPGDTWERTFEFRLQAGQSLTFTTQYEYVGQVEKDGQQFDKVKLQTTKVEYRGGDDSQPLVVSDSDLKVKSSSGELLFDRKRKQIAYVAEKLNISGELTFKVTANDKELPGKLDLTLEVDTTLLP